MNTQNKRPHTFFVPALFALSLVACATAQENPNYQHSTTYNGSSPYTQSASTVSQGTHVTNASYQTQSSPIIYDSPAGYSSVTQRPDYQGQTYQGQTYQGQTYQANSQYSVPSYTQAGQTRLDQDCLSRETNRELLGGALGGTVGAIAGKKLIGGTKGTVAGALVGGAAGYGIGDKSINCDPVPVAAPVSYPSQYQSTPTTYYPASSQTAPQMSSQTSTQYQPAQSVSAAPSTDTYYGETVGTPGYEVMQRSTSIPTTLPPPTTQTNAGTISYDSSNTHNSTRSTGTTTQTVSEEKYPTIEPGNYSGSYGTTHTVVQKDTVYSLSRKVCASVEEVQSMNGIDGSYAIKIGQTLRLPRSKC